MRLFRIFATGALLLVVGASALANDTAKSGITAPNIDSITLGDIKSDVYFLACDEMVGRETTRPESRIASAYARSRMERAGVKPAGENGGWYQTVKLRHRAWEETPTLSWQADGKTHELKYGEDFVSTGGAEASLEMDAAEVVFAGYAVNDSSHSYNDIEGVDLRGKLALIMRYEPTPWMKSGRNPFSRNAYLQTKEALCRAAGAVGVLMVTAPRSLGGSDNRRQLPSPDAGDKSPPLELDLGEEQPGDESLPFFHVSIEACDMLLGGEGETELAQKAFDDADFGKRPDLSGLSVKFKAKSGVVHEQDRNVAGMIKGETDEWIVFGAHHDHLGYGYFGARDARTAMGQIHNGADDNASGVSTVLEIAEALARSGRKPRRSFLFLTFTGEEKGLLGSEWYCRHPLIPHERVVAMINIDMIGRIDQHKLTMDGTSCSKLLDSTCKEVAPLFPELTVEFSDKPPMPASDHWPFFSLAGVPCFFPFGGVNKFMHTAEDDPETINYDDMLVIIKMLYEIAWRLSESKEYADYSGPIKDSIGPDGKPRDPSAPKPVDPDEELEEEFSSR
ncbi:MAG: M20/M25/M40 family metallo-hydrolase [Planctomycetes bacterium]|nr:M20/M25/M40 family metallo-hydrolase [Planctomycetota bacterium]